MDHKRDLEALEARHRSETEAAQKSADEERAALEEISKEREALKAGHEREIAAIHADADAQASELELKSSRFKDEIRQAQDEMEIIRRVKEFRGSIWLTVRRSAYDPEKMIATLCDVLGVPTNWIRLIND